MECAGISKLLSIGIIGVLIFGLGMSLAMQVLGTGVLYITIGIVCGIIGLIGICIAYPVYQKEQEKAKKKYTPRILELIEKLIV